MCSHLEGITVLLRYLDVLLPQRDTTVPIKARILLFVIVSVRRYYYNRDSSWFPWKGAVNRYTGRQTVP